MLSAICPPTNRQERPSRSECHLPIPLPDRDTYSPANLELCECMLDIAAAMFNVCGRELRKPGRSSQAVSRVRQIAMYICHVVLGIGMRDIGAGFGRDRTTVLYACQVVEDLRDDEESERLIAALEKVGLALLRLRREAAR